MRNMTSEDFKNLKYNDVVYKISRADCNCRSLHFMTKLPYDNDAYLFADGSYTEIKYDSTVSINDWYIGKYDSEEIGKIIISKLEDRIKSVKKVYFKEKI